MQARPEGKFKGLIKRNIKWNYPPKVKSKGNIMKLPNKFTVSESGTYTVFLLENLRYNIVYYFMECAISLQVR